MAGSTTTLKEAGMPASRPANKTADFVWLNGDFVGWEEATVHATSMGASGGVSVFEGIKAHSSPDGDELFVFCLPEHLRRLSQSAKMMRMATRWSETDLRDATLELLRRNRTK